MKNCINLIFILFISSYCFAQTKQITMLNGRVLSDSLAIENAHIINKTTSKGVVTNLKGVFKIPVTLGDILYISHINFENTEIMITRNLLKDQELKININPKTYALEEIEIKKRKGIFEIEKDILPASKINAITLNLPYANIKAKPENKDVLRPESGLAVNLVSLINSFNGKRKKAKELKNAKIKDQKFDALKSKFQKSFFYTHLKIKKGYINQFLEYCIKEGVHNYREKDNIIKLTNYLIQKSKTFPYTEASMDTLLTKK